MSHPFPDSEPVELQTALGRLVMAWAPLEFALDGIASTLHTSLEGSKIRSRLPFPFSEKVNFIKDCFQGVVELKPLWERLNESLNEASELSDNRNWLIHGFIPDPWPTDGKIIVYKLAYGKIIHNVGGKTFTVSDIHDIASRIMALSKVALDFGNNLLSLAQIIKQNRSSLS